MLRIMTEASSGSVKAGGLCVRDLSLSLPLSSFYNLLRISSPGKPCLIDHSFSMIFPRSRT